MPLHSRRPLPVSGLPYVQGQPSCRNRIQVMSSRSRARPAVTRRLRLRMRREQFRVFRCRGPRGVSARGHDGERNHRGQSPLAITKCWSCGGGRVAGHLALRLFGRGGNPVCPLRSCWFPQPGEFGRQIIRTLNR